MLWPLKQQYSGENHRFPGLICELEKTDRRDKQPGSMMIFRAAQQ
jgi:hypothetical protein